MSTDGQLSFFPADDTPDGARYQVRAYVATAMTGLSDADREAMHEKAKEARAVLGDLGVASERVYLPQDHSDPVTHADLPPQSVAWMNEIELLDADLVVYLADHPSTGSGIEIGFSARLMCRIYIAAGAGPVSRFVAAYGQSVEDSCRSSSGLRAHLTRFVVQNMPVLAEHARWRATASAYAEQVHGPLREAIGRIRAIERAERDREVNAEPSLLSEDRLTRLQSHPILALGMTLSELLRIGHESGLGPWGVVEGAGPLLSDERAALREAADAERWDVATVLDLQEFADRRVDGARARRSLGSASTWRALNDLRTST